MAEKLSPFHKLLNAKTPIKKTLELKKSSDSENKAVSDACEIALKQPL